MERQRKERLVGAAVLIMLAVIFIPMVLDDSVQPDSGITGTNIPARPEGEFESRVIPLTPANNAGRGPGSEIGAAQGPAGEPAAEPGAVMEKPPGESAPSAVSAPPVATPVSPGIATASPAGAPVSPVTAPENAHAKDVPATAQQEQPQKAGVTAWVVQLGSFASAENAETLNKKLRQSGYAAFVEPLQQGGAKVYRVRVGPELRRSGAQSVRDRLQANMGLDGIVVPYP